MRSLADYRHVLWSQLRPLTVVLTLVPYAMVSCSTEAAAPAARSPAPKQDLDAAQLAGEWEVRIDGGGEIYKAVFDLRLEEGKVSGRYEADGNRGRISSIRRDGKVYFIEASTVQAGMQATALFAFELIDGRWKGDVDYEAGSNVRSYEFEATRIPDVKTKRPVTAADQKPAALPESTMLPVRDTDRKQGKVEFQNGKNRYKGAVDTEIWAIAPSKALDRQGTMTTDGNNGGGESQVLMRFSGIFGDREDQAPRTCRIVAAKLTVVAFDPGTTVYLHRVLVPWDASATWQGMAAGLSIDNVEASTVRDGFSFGQITMDKQSVEFDVTQTVQKWADGAPNQGWVFVNTGGNGWDFYSSDWIEQGLRPKLEIEYEIR